MLALLALGAAPARAEDQAPVYNFVAEWAVPREQWRDYAKNASDMRPTLDKLVADGVLVGYGQFTQLLHHEGRSTHGLWLTATSRAGLLNALEETYKLPQITFPVLANSKHEDFLTVSRIYGIKSGKVQNGYFAGGYFNVKPGSTDAFRELTKKHIAPVMEKLRSEGAVAMWSLDEEDFHSGGANPVLFYYATETAAGIDKVSDAIDAAFASHPELEASFRSLTESAGHSDMLGRIPMMVNK
jgi:hypothetical protein